MSFFSKTKTILSPMTGKVIPVSEVDDAVFKDKILGDGVGIIPEEKEILAPCDGKIMQIAHTKHAVCLKTKDGLEILLHFGIDTVNLEGDGFECFVNEGDEVKAGQKIMDMDIDFIKEKGYSLQSPCIITNLEIIKSLNINTGKAIKGETEIITYKV